MKKKTKSLIVSFVLAFTLLFSAPVALTPLKTEGAKADASEALTADKVFTYADGVRAEYKSQPAGNDPSGVMSSPSAYDADFKGNSIWAPLTKDVGDAVDTQEKAGLSGRYARSMTVDVSDNTKDDVLFEWKPVGAVKGSAYTYSEEIVSNSIYRTFRVKIIDSADTSKFIELYYHRPGVADNGYIKNSSGYDADVYSELYVVANGQSKRGGIDAEAATATFSEFGTTVTAIGAAQNAVPDSLTQKIYYDATEKAIYADVKYLDATSGDYKIEKKLVRDLDATDATNGTDTAWAGFTSNKVYIQVEHTTGGGSPGGYGFMVRELDGIKMKTDASGAITDTYRVVEPGVYTQSAYSSIADVTVVEGEEAPIVLPARKDGQTTDATDWTVTAVDADGADVTATLVTGLSEGKWAEGAKIAPTRGTTTVTLSKGGESVMQKFVVAGLKQAKVTIANAGTSSATVNGAAAADFTDVAEGDVVIAVTEDPEYLLTSIMVNGTERIADAEGKTLTLTYDELTYKTEIVLGFQNVYKMNLVEESESGAALGTIVARKDVPTPFNQTDADKLTARKGYTVEYKNADGSIYDWTLSSSADITLIVDYTPIVYNVTVNAFGGEYDTAAIPATVTVESEITLPTVTKTGYTFIGWYTDAQYVYAMNNGVFANAWEVDERNGGNGVELYAWLSADHYYIDYVTDGGVLSGDYTYDFTVESTTLALPTVTKTGYTLLGWYDGETLVENGATLELANKTLTAKWELATYTVTFDVEGTETTDTYKMDKSDVLTFPEAVKEHYTLVGWQVDGGDVITADEFDYTSGSVTLTAVFEETKYSVLWDTKGGTIDDTVYDKYVTLSMVNAGTYVMNVPAVSREGYTFAGWWLDYDNGTEIIPVEIYDGYVAYLDASYLADGASAFYAKWTPIEYTLTLDAMGGTIGAGERTVTFTVETTEIKLPTAATAGLEFMGWYTSMSGLANEKVSAGAYTFPASDLTLYAKYDLENYDVTYVADGATFAVVNVVKNGTVTKITANPVKEGYTFVGWYVGDAAYTFGTIATADVTLTAKFEAITYKIVLDGNGATLTDDAVEFTLETTAIALPTPAREGYTFDGWYENGVKVDPATYTVSIGNKVFEAKWTAVPAAEEPAPEAEGCGKEAAGLLAVVLSALAAVLVIKKK